MPQIADHPLRFELANELHARPFPVAQAPGRAAFLAIKPGQNAAGRDRAADMAHLTALLDRFAAPHPEPDATHYFGQIGKHQLKWESHTEFVTYTILGAGVADTPFDAATFQLFPEDWLHAAPGTRVTSALIRIDVAKDDDQIIADTDDWFVPESLAISRVLDDELVIAGDFRIDPAGHMRFAIFSRPTVGKRRIGRVVQRLCEIETYKAMSMLGLSRARSLGAPMGAIDGKLAQLIADLRGANADAEAQLNALLDVSAELESIAAQSSFRFGATEAYETIVNQRIQVLREARFAGRQTFGEFMMRRYNPAMRTVASTQLRLKSMSDRALRAGDLLRTRVDVERSAQNQALLTSMDRRADLQLRLQHTVEGLSIVAISYYALNLVLYIAGPLQYALEISKVTLAAVATPIVVVCVWAALRRIRKHL
jgi:uncharacterized membrane-anchored protein